MVSSLCGKSGKIVIMADRRGSYSWIIYDGSRTGAPIVLGSSLYRTFETFEECLDDALEYFRLLPDVCPKHLDISLSRNGVFYLLRVDMLNET